MIYVEQPTPETWEYAKPLSAEFIDIRGWRNHALTTHLILTRKNAAELRDTLDNALKNPEVVDPRQLELPLNSRDAASKEQERW